MTFSFLHLNDDVHRAQAIEAAAPQRHLGLRAFILHARPLEQRGWEQQGCKWRPRRVSLCHPRWGTQHHETTEAAAPRPPSCCSLMPPRMQHLPPPSSPSKATGMGAAAAPAERRTRAHHVFTEIPWTSFECVHHEFIALVDFFIESSGWLINGGWTNGGNEYGRKWLNCQTWNADGLNEWEITEKYYKWIKISKRDDKWLTGQQHK
jgi:hypothetical protein